MSSAVDIIDLHHRYTKDPVLRRLRFSVEAGEFFIIIGPNGSGKTTLLKIMAGIAPSTGGEVRIFDRPIERYPAQKRAATIAYVPQTSMPEFPFTVMETVLMGRAPYLGPLGIEGKRDLRIAREALVFTGVDHLADRKINQLSGGEQQRAAIARAICQQPDIILLDEPTAALDLAHQVRIMDLMERLKKEEGITVVMVSHDLNLAAMYGDRLLLLQSGRLAGLGSPHEVLTYRTLEQVYGCTLLVDRSPIEGCPRITLVPHRILEKMSRQYRGEEKG